MAQSADSSDGSLWNSQWSNATLLVGLGIPVIVWMLALFGNRLSALMTQIAMPVLVVAMLVYPLATRRRVSGGILAVPGFKQLAREIVPALLVAAGCLLLNLLVMVVSRWLWPDVGYAPDRLHRAARSSLTAWFVMIAVYSTFFTPLAEEVFFRGFLLSALRRRLPAFAAVLIQAVGFGVMHAYSIGATISTVLVGAAFGVFYCRRQSVLAPYLAHAAYNAVGFAVIISGMLASGGQATLGVIPDMNSARCVVSAIVLNSPAERAGLNAGDIILKINEHPITTSKDLLSRVSGFKPGTTITVQFTRNDNALTKQIQLVRRDQTGRKNTGAEGSKN